MAFDEGLIPEDVARVTVGLNAALIEDDDAGAEFEDEFEVVCGDELSGGFAGEYLDEAAAGAEVEIAGGFVEDEKFGAAGENSCEGDAFAFAKTELLGVAAFKSGEADGVEGFEDTGADFPLIEAEIEGAEGNVFHDSGAKELVVRVLKEKSDTAADFLKVTGNDGESGDSHGGSRGCAGSAGEETIEVHEEGGLAGPVGAEEGDAFGGGKREGDLLQGCLSGGVTVVETVDLEQGGDGGIHDWGVPPVGGAAGG